MNIFARNQHVGQFDQGGGHQFSVNSRGEARQRRVSRAIEKLDFIRGEGGWGGDRGPSGPRNVAPERAPDHQVTYQTREDQALLYRLNGDRNPLHSDPKFAAKGGFPKPILHGLCTYGFTGRALLHELCGSEPSRFGSMEARFASPVMPGEALTVKMWDDGDGAVFQTCATDDRVVMDGGRFTYRKG